MRILIADQLPSRHVTRLSESHEVRVEPTLSGEALARAVDTTEVLIVRSTRVDEAVFAAAPALGLVVRAGSGVDTIDVDAAQRFGVNVANVPGRNAAAVAELTMALMLALDRRLVDQALDLREGRWRKKDYQHARGLAGRRVGIVGLGAIGIEVAIRVAAFGCVPVAIRTRRSGERERQIADIGIEQVEDLDALAASCDVLTFHVPLAPETRGVIGEPLLTRVPDGAIIINTARGELIDEDALVRALETKELLVGLDVHPGEPSSSQGTISNRLIAHRRVIGTHHCGASTQQAQDAVADEVVAIIESFAQGAVRNAVVTAAGRAQP